MAAITATQIQTRVETLMRTQPCIAWGKIAAADDADANIIYVKDSQGGTSASAANARGHAGEGWKGYSYADVGTAYSL